MRIKKIAIIGCGSIGRRHIKNFLSCGCNVVAWNRGDERRLKVEKDFKIKTYSSFDELVINFTPDAAIICTPNLHHIKNAIYFARKGINLFIEKPLSFDLTNIDTLELLIKKNNLICHVGSNMRYHFGPKSIKKIIDSKNYGKVVWANIWAGMYLPDWHPKEDYKKMYSSKTSLKGGAVLDFIHEIDLVLWMFGKPEKVLSIVQNLNFLDIETEEIADVIFKYKKKQLNLHIDYLQKPFQRGIRILFERGWCEWDLNYNKIKVFDYTSDLLNEISMPNGYNKNNMYLLQTKVFIKALNKKNVFLTDLKQAIESLNLALKIKKKSI